MTFNLGERRNRIFEFMVRDFIKTAEPVSSSRIREGLKLKESPATIRNVVSELDESGFFEQPHVSSGRVPTDKAYRYFVDNFMTGSAARRGVSAEIRQLARAQEDISRFFSEALNLLSFSSVDGGNFSFHGFSLLFQEPEFKESDSVYNAGYIADNIDGIARLYKNLARKKVQIFIGGENPVGCAREFGAFYLEYMHGGRAQTILLFGPKRMDYERVYDYSNCFLKEF